MDTSFLGIDDIERLKLKALEALGGGQEYQGLPLAPGVSADSLAQEMAATPKMEAPAPQRAMSPAVAKALSKPALKPVNEEKDLLSDFAPPANKEDLKFKVDPEIMSWKPDVGQDELDAIKPDELSTEKKIGRAILSFLQAGSGNKVTDWDAVDKAAYEQKIAPLLLKKKLEEGNLANTKAKMELFKLNKEGALGDPNSQESIKAREALKATYAQAGLGALASKISDNLSVNDLKNFPGSDKVVGGMFDADKEKRQLAMLERKEQIADEKQTKQNAKLSPSDIMKVSEGKNMDNILAGVEKQLNLHKDVMGPVQGRLKAMNPYDTEAQSFQSSMATAAQLIGKYMEGGVLRAEDVPKYQKMLPQMNDTPEVAKRKLDNVRTMLKEKYGTEVEALKAQGKNVTGFESAPKEVKPSSLLEVGAIKGGYRFKGGNPKDAKNWEKV